MADMKPKVNYKPSTDIDSAVRGASLAWATEKEEEDGTTTPTDPNDVEGGDDPDTPSGDLEG